MSVECLPDQPTDIYSESKWVYLISTVFGMAPVTVIKRSQVPRVIRVEFSCLKFVYSLAIVSFIVPSMLLGLAKDLLCYLSDMPTVRMKNKTSMLATFSDCLSVMLTATVGVLFSAVRSGQIARLMQHIYEVDIFFCTITQDTPCDVFLRNKTTKRHTLYLICGIFSPLILLFLLDVWVWGSVTNRLPYIYFPTYGLYVLISVLEMQFVYVVRTLQQRFNHFNEQLARISLDDGFTVLPRQRVIYDDENLNETFFRAEVTTVKSLISARRPVMFRRRKLRNVLTLGAPPTGVNHQTNTRVPGGWSGSSRQSLYQTLKSLCSLHAELCELITEVNSAYSLQMLMYVLMVFIHFIITPYFFLMNLVYPATYGRLEPSFLFVQSMWILFHVGKLFLVVHPCSATYKEANITQTVVTYLLNGNFDSDVKKQLENFSLQLFHRRVEFSACGFCTIDYPLIASIVGSVTTYLVILMQFQNSDTSELGANNVTVRDKPSS